MTQVYEPYNRWEDYHAGMYKLDVTDKDKYVINALSMLSDTELFYLTCKEIKQNWKIATDVNLTNKGQNRRAWLGAAACCYKYGTPEFLTRIAWGLLNRNVQDAANEVAEQIIREYELNHTNHAKTLFDI